MSKFLSPVLEKKTIEVDADTSQDMLKSDLNGVQLDLTRICCSITISKNGIIIVNTMQEMVFGGTGFESDFLL